MMTFNLSTLYRYFTVIFVLYSIGLHGKPYKTLFKPHFEEPRSSIKGIEGVYVINLDIRPEKWHRLEPILYYHGVCSTRFSAVFGMDFDIPTIKYFGAKHLRPGGLGCMLSHLSIYHDALKRGLKTIWVVEDDLEILRDPKLLTGILKELNTLDPEWDILYTDLNWVKKDGSFVNSAAFPIDKKNPFPFPLEYYSHRENISENIQLLRSRYGTASMIMSERGMKKILNHFTTNDDIIWPYDIELHYVPKIRQYGIINPIATNGHFSYNFSDTGCSVIKDFYEISDEHVKYLEERHALLSNIIKNWSDFYDLKRLLFTLRISRNQVILDLEILGLHPVSKSR